MKSLSHPIKSVKDSAVREILPGLLLSFAIAAVSRLLAIYLPQLGGATIAILLGILLGNTFFKQPVLAIGTKFAESKLLEFSVFLLGATVTAQTIAQIGVKGIVFVLLQMSITIIGAYLIGKRKRCVWFFCYCFDRPFHPCERGRKRTDHHTGQSTRYCDDVDPPFSWITAIRRKSH